MQATNAQRALENEEYFLSPFMFFFFFFIDLGLSSDLRKCV